VDAMLLKEGKNTATLKKTVGLQGPVMVISDDMHIQMRQVEVTQLLALLNDPEKGSIVGIPHYFATNLPENELLVYPAPRQDMECEFYFYPPMSKQ
jgi:hypothetical protein